MRTSRLCTMLTLVSALAAPAAAHAQFEGVITFVSHGQEEGDRTFVEWMKGAKTRIDMQRSAGGGEGMGTASMIWDGAAKTTTMVMHDRKMYMQMGATNPSRPMEMDDDDRKEKAAAKWTKTGKRETVAGTSCEIWHGTITKDGGTKEADVCLAKGIGFMMGAGTSGSRNPLMAGMRQFSGIGAGDDMGVLKVTSYEAGKTRVDLEATKIEKKSLADTDFQPPADYKAFARPMMGPPGGPPGAGRPPRR